MKKLLIAGLVVFTALALTGCGASGYTSDRVKKSTEEGADVLSAVQGAEVTNATTDAFYVESTGASASSLLIDATALFGAQYPNSKFDSIDMSLLINKSGTGASLFIIFTVAGEEMPVAFVTSAATNYKAGLGFNFTAQLVDLDTETVDPSGLTVMVTGVASVGGAPRVTIKLTGSSANFANGTPLTAGLLPN